MDGFDCSTLSMVAVPACAASHSLNIVDVVSLPATTRRRIDTRVITFDNVCHDIPFKTGDDDHARFDRGVLGKLELRSVSASLPNNEWKND